MTPTRAVALGGLMLALSGMPASAGAQRAPAPKPAAASTAKAPAASTAKTPTASTATGTAGRVTPTSCPSFKPAMARGRKLTLQKDYPGALAAFAEAIRARPVDAGAWAERGYALLLSGGDAGEHFRRARALTKDRALLAQIWFNEGLLRTREGNADAARIAFVMAEANGSTAAKSKLGTASRCAATWTTAPAALPESLAIVRTWREVRTAAQLLCDTSPGAPVSEAEARRITCLGCAGHSDPSDTDQCTGPGPWTIQSGYMHFHIYYALVQPLAKGTFYVTGTIGSAPRPLERAGDAWRILDEEPRMEEIPAADGAGVTLNALDVWSDQADEDNAPLPGACKPDLQADVALGRIDCVQCGQAATLSRDTRTQSYHALTTGETLLLLTAWSSDVRATVKGATATITGGGCNAVVPLRAPAPP